MNPEQSVLGAIMQDHRAIDDVIDLLNESDFATNGHRLIWRSLIALTEDGEPLDVITVCERLDKCGDLDRVGGLQYVGSLANEVPGSSNVIQYAKYVKDQSMTRQLSAIGSSIGKIATEKGVPLDEKLDHAQHLVMEISEKRITDGPKSAAEILPSVISNLESRFEAGGEIIGLSTGLVDLDKKINGLRKKDLIIIAGRPSMGKTTLATNMARHASLESGVPSLVFSLEMGSEQLIDREISAIGTIEHDVIQSGKLNDTDWSSVTSAVMRLKGSSLIIDDTPSLSVNDIRARARRVKRANPELGLIVVDYIQLARGVGNNRTEEVGDISRGLKGIAKELDVPVVALSQLSRKVEERSDKRPIASDLRESGSIEQDADIIIFVYRDEVYNQDSPHKGVAEIIINKHRNGSIGMVPATFQGKYCRFMSFVGEYSRPEPTKQRRGMS